uniref:F-box domain-containing protein n=1 Tax=Marseillevirus LCMAC102 TaxID=2506603 RepID=A0A481YUQ7_9VIRU|nr:MAG: hypothetical protein LCMAC102_00590 [Marseillevirus LCMAC102]
MNILPTEILTLIIDDPENEEYLFSRSLVCKQWNEIVLQIFEYPFWVVLKAILSNDSERIKEMLSKIRCDRDTYFYFLEKSFIKMKYKSFNAILTLSAYPDNVIHKFFYSKSKYDTANNYFNIGDSLCCFFYDINGKYKYIFRYICVLLRERICEQLPDKVEFDEDNFKVTNYKKTKIYCNYSNEKNNICINMEGDLYTLEAEYLIKKHPIFSNKITVFCMLLHCLKNRPESYDLLTEDFIDNEVIEVLRGILDETQDTTPKVFIMALKILYDNFREPVF